MKDYSKFLVQEDLIYFQPTLAKNIGLNEAILLQKIQGWLQCKPHDAEGRSWIYNTYKSWQEQLPFWSEDTIRRTLNRLVDMGAVIRSNFNQTKFDRTYWYSIDYDKLDELCSCKLQSSMCAICTDGSEQLANTYTNDYYNDNKESNNINIITKESKKKTPTLEEIETYIREKNLNVNGKEFYDYFEAGNWTDSKGNKVKNWKQKLLTWNKYGNNKSTPKRETVIYEMLN